MTIIFHSWKKSLLLLAPHSLFDMAKDIFAYWMRALRDVVLVLKWFIVADIIIFLIGGRKLFLVLEQMATNQQNIVPLPVLLLSVAVSIITFLLQGAFVVFIRRRNVSMSLRDYFRIYFLRYAQLALFFSFSFILFFSLIMGLGVTKIPTGHWTVVFCFHLIELLILFYWLDSQFSFKKLLHSCEQGLNFFMYNFPLFVVVIALFFVGRVGMYYIVQHIHQDVFMVQGHGVIPDIISGIGIAVLRYVKFLLEFLWISFLFVVYRRRKGFIYHKSLFNH